MVTYVHHNPDGQLTWVTYHSSVKLWFIVHPKSLEGQKQKSLENLFCFYDKLLPDLLEIPDGIEICPGLLEPGDVLSVLPLFAYPYLISSSVLYPLEHGIWSILLLAV